ncbi:MAG: A/G-specific adenine glycosylase [Fibrobacter sp.]|nr:A/G-specific adenine glycosylase [Fibrobacter sp.]
MTNDSLKRLRDWFKKNAAMLPWRSANLDAPRDAYAVWISETMLQQTQVSTVKDYFIRWMNRFPNVDTLAKADETEVFKYWQGLGYYSRARNILKTARIICQRKTDLGTHSAGSVQVPSEMTGNAKFKNTVESEMPRTRKELEALPGIGAYTAGAILSLAYHKREAILDGNLVRIFSRLYELDFLPTESKSASEIYWIYAREIANSPKAYIHNEALMELGRTVCKTKNPLCEKCPLHNGCHAFTDGRTDKFPPAKKRTEKNWHGTVLVVESKDGKILAVNGGQKFLDRQLSLPHFESVRGAAIGIPAKAEDYINADEVEAVNLCGTFHHNITVHKIECNVLHVRLAAKAKDARTSDTYTTTWIEKAKAFETFANSFTLKALKKAF